jgi:hypothetical protein
MISLSTSNSYLQLKPISREGMQTLKVVKQDIHKRTQLDSIIRHIYQEAVSKASNSLARTYREAITINTKDYTMSINNIPFERVDIQGIISKLRELFPECSVEHTMLSRGQDGKLYDLAKMEEKALQSVLPFVNRTKDQAYIIIDWS